MTEKQYEDAMFALGCKDVTSKTQKKNGTMAFRLPDGKNMVTEHKSGYIRRTMLSKTGRVASWASAKTIDMTIRRYNSTYTGQIHRASYWDGGGPAFFPQPIIKITALG